VNLKTKSRNSYNSSKENQTVQLEKYKGFCAKSIDREALETIKTIAKKVRLNAAQMINNAGSGHIGGSCSSIDIYLMLWLFSNISPQTILREQRDRIVISHGHTSAGVYSVLGNLGYFNMDDAVQGFRRGNSIFEGHPSLEVPGVEFCNGVLGQGLSQGCGLAMAARIKELDYRVFVVMGDGEQAKGQIQEAREFAAKHKLSNLTAIVDYNKLQASGELSAIMPQNIIAKYSAAGWKVVETDGHDYQKIYSALSEAYQENAKPVLILANTVMGKGFPEIEGNFEYHGRLLDSEIIMREEEILQKNQHNYEILDNSLYGTKPGSKRIITGKPREYQKEEILDSRSAFGNALVDIAEANKSIGDNHIVAVDCDLIESVKVKKFSELFNKKFIECGIAEHNAATIANTLSKENILVFFAAFAVFGIDETFSQHRIADMNNSNLKLICTHCGLDVGEDGKTHQCIDYISLLSNLKRMKIIIPADANQTDRIVRYVSKTNGSFAVLMGRSKIPIVTDDNDIEFFIGNYTFEYGKADWLRNGEDGVIVTYGNMVPYALEAAQQLKNVNKDIAVLNVSCPLEPDVNAIKKAAQTGLIVVYEDHNVQGGLGSLLSSYLLENGIHCKFKRFGVKEFGCSAPPKHQYLSQGLDVDSLVSYIEKNTKQNYRREMKC